MEGSLVEDCRLTFLLKMVKYSPSKIEAPLFIHVNNLNLSCSLTSTKNADFNLSRIFFTLLFNQLNFYTRVSESNPICKNGYLQL